MADGTKGRKITHMIARLFYVLILISGVLLFVKYSSADAALYGVKFLLGLLTIGMMEMVLVRSEKGKSVKRCMDPVFRFPIRYNVPRIQIASWHQLVHVTDLIRNVMPTGSCCQWAFFCN